MKLPASIIVLVSISLNFAVGGAEPEKPRKALIGDWSELSEDEIAKIQLTKFDGIGECADGGSWAADFYATGTKDVIQVAAVNTLYWTEEEIEARFQVYYFLYKGRFYRIQKGSNQEYQIIGLLKDARIKLEIPKEDLKHLDRMIETLETRKPFDRTWTR